MSRQTGLYIRGQQVSIPIEEALNILKTADHSTCIAVPPTNVQDGDVYVYKPVDVGYSDSWKEDGYQWRIISSVHLPRKKPTILKRVYARILPDGKVDKELRKEVYCEDRGEDKHKLALLHFLGNFRSKASATVEVEEDCSLVEDIAAHSTQQTDQQSETPVCITAGHGALESNPSELVLNPQLDNMNTDVSDLNVDIQSKGAVTDSNTEPVSSASGSVDFSPLKSLKQAADSSTGPEELESAWKTLQMALGKKSGSQPVVEMVNKLMESVTSTEENSELDYCLVVSDKKSGKSSVIGTPEIAPRRSGRKRPTEQVEHQSASDSTDRDMNEDETVIKKMFQEGGGSAQGKLTPKLFIPSIVELGDQEVMTAKGDVVKFPHPCKETYFSYSVISDEERKIHSDFFDKKRASKTAERYLKIRNHMIGTWLQQQPRHVSKSQSRKGLKDCGDVTPMSRIHTYLECKGVINFKSVKSRPWMKKDKGTTLQSTFPESKRRKVISTGEFKTTENEDNGNDDANDVGDMESDTDFDSSEETEVISRKGKGTKLVKSGISQRRTDATLRTKEENGNPKQTAAATTRLDVRKRFSVKSDTMSVILSSNKKNSDRVSDVNDVVGTPIETSSDETIGVRSNDRRTRNVATALSVVKDVMETVNVTPIKASSDKIVGVRSSSRRTRNIATPNWADILSGRKSFKEDGGVLVHIKKEPIDNEYENSTVQGSIKENMEEKSSKKKLNKSSVNAKITVDTMIADDSEQSTSQVILHTKPSHSMNKQKKPKPAQLDKGGMGSEVKKVANTDTDLSKNMEVTDITSVSKDSAISEINDHRPLTDSETEYGSPDDVRSGSTKQTAYKYTCTECDQRFCVGYLLEEHMKNIHSKMVDGVEAENVDSHGVYDDIHMAEGDDDDDYADDVDVADDEDVDAEDDEDDEILNDLEFVPEINETKIVKQAKKRTANVHFVAKDGQKPKCNICGQVFLTEANRKRHSLLHTNKMYECPFCAKIMKRMDYVTQHVRKVHKDQDIENNPIDFEKFTHVIEPELEDNAEQQDSRNENNDESDDVKPPRMKVVTGLGKKVCPECSKLYDTQEDLEQHMILVHKKELKDAAYTCQGCKKQFKTLVSYQVHKLSHRKKDHVCQHCGKTFVNNSQLQVHRRHDHQIQYGTLMYFGYLLNEGRLSCEICSADFDNMDEFHEHRPLHVIFDYMCKECGNGFILQADLKRHISSACSYLNMHLPCGACELQFSMYDTRRKHILGNHPKETDFFCHHCGISFPNLQSLTEHFPMHKEEKIFVCEFCDKKFFEKRNLVDHRDLHRSSKNWQCHICDRFYISSKSLQRHIKLHLNRSLKNCKFCDSKFSTNEDLEEHLISNHSEEDTSVYQTCKICSRSFLDKSRLMKHMQIHNGDNTYTCDICNETLDANYLPPWKHMKKAHPEEAKRKVKRTFQCDECTFITEYKQRLERHMETHRKTKDFECDYCGRKYQTTSSLLTHMIIHRGKVKKGAKPEPICTWTNCNKRYIKHSLFKRHLISHIFKVKVGKDLCECGRCQYSTPQSGPTYFMQGESEYTAVGFVDEDGNPLVASKLESNQDQTNVINVHVLSSGEVEQRYESMDVLQEAIAQIEDIENKNSTVQGKPSQKGTASGAQIQGIGEVEKAESDPSLIIVLDSKDGKESIEEAKEEQANKVDAGMPELQRMVEKATQETSTSIEGDSQTVEAGIAIEGTSQIVGTGTTVEGASQTVEAGIAIEGTSQTVGTGTAVEGASQTVEAGTQSIVQEVEVSGIGTSSNVSSYTSYNYECGVCELMFQFKCNVVTHMEEDHPEHKFPHCPTCGKCIIDKKNLRDHMIIHEDTRGFSCTVCNKAFRTKQCLRQHSYIHAVTKPFTCNFCGHGFTQKGFYFEHIRRHTGIKPFKCSVCSKAFVSKNLLRIHMFSHASIRPHKCECCPKSFSENYQLVAHMRTHNDDRPFECSECDKAFFVRPKLIRHLNTVHGIDKEVLTNYVATRIGDGVGYRDKTKLQNQSAQNKPSQKTQVVYIDSHGNIVSQDVKDEAAVKMEQKQDISLRRSVKIRPSAPFIILEDPDTILPEHIENDVKSFEVVTKRDEHGGVQVNAVIQAEINMHDPAVEMEQVVFQGADGCAELNGENYTLITQENGQSDHIALITQAEGVEASSNPDHCQGDIEVSEEQEVCDEELGEDGENIKVISEADLTTTVDGTENFSINIREDGTVDAADFEKIEALRNMYSDQQIVIVLESQQQ